MKKIMTVNRSLTAEQRKSRPGTTEELHGAEQRQTASRTYFTLANMTTPIPGTEPVPPTAPEGSQP